MRKVSLETRLKISKAHKGLRHTRATKKKIGAASAERWKTEEFRNKFVGRTRSKASRKRISEAMSSLMTSEEHKRKVSEGMKKAWARRKSQSAN